MKKLLTATLFALSMIPTADALEAPSTEILELCAQLENVAGIIQQDRQDGVPMSTLMRAVGHNEILAKIVILAWNESQMLHEENQKKKVAEFKDDIYLMCVEGKL